MNKRYYIVIFLAATSLPIYAEIGYSQDNVNTQQALKTQGTVTIPVPEVKQAEVEMKVKEEQKEPATMEQAQPAETKEIVTSEMVESLKGNISNVIQSPEVQAKVQEVVSEVQTSIVEQIKQFISNLIEQMKQIFTK